jgi:hypothetical protein
MLRSCCHRLWRWEWENRVARRWRGDDGVELRGGNVRVADSGGGGGNVRLISCAVESDQSEAI